MRVRKNKQMTMFAHVDSDMLQLYREKAKEGKKNLEIPEKSSLFVADQKHEKLE